jgi:hypothetical protein
MVLALQDNTFLDVWPCSHRLLRSTASTTTSTKFEPTKVVLHKGDALLFRGDLTHAGSAYDLSNTRVHVYLDTNVKRVENRSWIISKHAPSDFARMICEASDVLLKEKEVQPKVL